MSLPSRPDATACWRRRLRDAAPMMTSLEIRLLAVAFANPEGTPDSLLILADALDEARQDRTMSAAGKDLRAIADMARATATFRAQRGSTS